MISYDLKDSAIMNTTLFTESPFHRIHPDISLLQLEIYSPLKAEFEHLEQFSRCHLGTRFCCLWMTVVCWKTPIVLSFLII